METFWSDYFPIIIRSFLIYSAIVIVMKLYGQKETGDFNMQDFVLVLLIAETTQHAMLGDNETLPGGFTAFFTIFFTDKLINRIFYRFPALKRTIEKPPAVVIARGNIMDKELKKLRLAREELYEMLREKGILSPREVRLAVIESDGEFSVIKEE